MTIRYLPLAAGLTALMAWLPLTAVSQDTLRQEVEVVKAYTPASIDAEKINDLPVIREEEHKKPDFSYSIFSAPVFSTLSVREMQAATVIGKPAYEPGYGIVRAGIGNYNKPYGELFFNNKENKNSIFGIHLKHLSSHGSLNLAGGDRVKAPFSDSEAEMFLKHMFRKSTLSMNLGVDHEGFRYYGYPGNDRGDTIPPFLKNGPTPYTLQGEKQAFTKGGIRIDLQNVVTSRRDPATGFNFEYYRYGARTGQREDFSSFTMDFHRPWDTFTFDIKAGAEYSAASGMYHDSTSLTHSRRQTWLFFKPSVLFGNPTLNLRAGFNAWFVNVRHDRKIFEIAPVLRLNFVPVKEIISVYAGVDGNYNHNHLAAISGQNPCVMPGLVVRNHFEQYRIYGGFDGRIAPKTNFRIQADYSSFEDYPFYYLPGFRLPVMGPLPGPAYADNTFRVLYDDLKSLKVNGEVTHHAGDKLNLLVSVNVYKHTPANEKEAWNLPAFDGTFSLGYQISDRLDVAADFYVIGKREALFVQFGDTPLKTFPLENGYSMFDHREYTLDTAIDLNLRGNYDITGKLAVFGQLNNFGFQKYQRWLGYPVQSLNLLGGISYSF